MHGPKIRTPYRRFPKVLGLAEGVRVAAPAMSAQPAGSTFWGCVPFIPFTHLSTIQAAFLVSL